MRSTVPALRRSARRVMSSVAGVVVMLIAGGPFFDATAANRFPRPEFQTPYQQPHTLFPGARIELMQYLDIALLMGALALAAWLVIGKRSRNGLILLTVACVTWFGFVRKGCVCPVGSIQNVTLAVFDSSFVLPVAVGVFFGIPLLFTLFFGRVFCSSVCPLGAIQDLVAFKPRRVPPWAVSVLGFFPHVYLGCAVLFAATGAGFIICKYDPFVGFFRLSGPPLVMAGGAVLLGIGVFVARPYCTTLCPYGVLLGWMSLLSRRHATITPDTCVNCRLCEDACPFGAIIPAATGAREEPRQVRMRRLFTHGAMLPVWVLLGLLAGSQIGGPLALVHPRVRLADQLALEEKGVMGGQTVESRTARMGSVPVSTVIGDAVIIRAQMKTGGIILGGYLGAVVGCSILAAVVRRRRTEYVIDQQRCLGCGRCFRSCPQEHLRLASLRQRGGSVET